MHHWAMLQLSTMQHGGQKELDCFAPCCCICRALVCSSWQVPAGVLWSRLQQLQLRHVSTTSGQHCSPEAIAPAAYETQQTSGVQRQLQRFVTITAGSCVHSKTGAPQPVPSQCASTAQTLWRTQVQDSNDCPNQHPHVALQYGTTCRHTMRCSFHQ
jgi:hypothetical protein